jgi:hypothetical protein
MITYNVSEYDLEVKNGLYILTQNTTNRFAYRRCYEIKNTILQS